MPQHATIQANDLTFLTQLAKNNNREWFNEHKMNYQESHQRVIAMADELLQLLKAHDDIETPNGKKSLHRIYRDIRFSKDKTPYHTKFSGSFKRATKKLRGGYYFHIEPGNSFLGGGFWGPEPKDLKRIREEIAADSSELKTILESASFKKYFGTLKGEQLKTAPKGFDKEHEAIDLLRYKQFLISHQFTDEEVLSENFVLKLNDGFKNMRPFFDYMSEVLTTNANGVSIV